VITTGLVTDTLASRTTREEMVLLRGVAVVRNASPCDYFRKRKAHQSRIFFQRYLLSFFRRVYNILILRGAGEQPHQAASHFICASYHNRKVIVLLKMEKLDWFRSKSFLKNLLHNLPVSALQPRYTSATRIRVS